MICNKCSAKIKPNAKVCKRCKTKVVLTESTPPIDLKSFYCPICGNILNEDSICQVCSLKNETSENKKSRALPIIIVAASVTAVLFISLAVAVLTNVIPLKELLFPDDALYSTDATDVTENEISTAPEEIPVTNPIENNVDVK